MGLQCPYVDLVDYLREENKTLWGQLWTYSTFSVGELQMMGGRVENRPFTATVHCHCYSHNYSC